MRGSHGVLLVVCGSVALSCGTGTGPSADAGKDVAADVTATDAGREIAADVTDTDAGREVAADAADTDAAGDLATDTPAEADVAPHRTFTFLTFNTGTTDRLARAGDPDGYSDALADVNASFYGNNLAWMPAQASLATLLQTLKPDVVNFQELYWDGHCTADCDTLHAADAATWAVACQGDAFACGTWTDGAPVTVRRILGPDYAVACAPNHPDNCVGVRKDAGTLKDCPDGPCIDGLDGLPPPNGCTNGARVATAVIDLADGPRIAVVDVHTTAGTNVECRTAQFHQVFEDRGDGKPAAFGPHDIVAGDMNIDPFLMDPEADASVAYWNDQVGEGKAFHYLSSPDQHGPNTHPYSFMKLDHVISDDLTGSCVVLGVAEGTAAPLSEDSTYFDHRPVYCTIDVP